ncbi:MAG TPA: hypothetical protein VHD90_20585, partial [Phototrophicaceae bacterium]|nr:hypothetical protein [Phototrophicaceae bacterium]
MRRCLVLLVCVILVACSSLPAPDNNTRHSNAPTVTAPAQFIEGDQPITVNNIANLKYLGRLDQPGTVSTLFTYALSPDDSRLAALNNEEILSWNLLDGKLLFQTSRSDATHLLYSSDKTELYGIDNTGLTVVYDSTTGATKTSFSGHPKYADVIAFSSDDGWLAFGGTDGSVKVWDSYARQSLVTFNADAQAVTALAFSPDGTQLATSGQDGAVRVWNWHDRKLLVETRIDPSLQVGQMAFSPDGHWLALGTSGDLRLWSMSKPSEVDTLNTGPGGAAQLLQFSPDGRFVLGGNQSSGLSMWTPDDHGLAARLPNTQGTTIAAAFSP